MNDSRWSVVRCPLSVATLLVALGLIPVLAVADDKAPPPRTTDNGQRTTDDVQDLVFLSDARPYLMRMHVQINGKPYTGSWDEFMKKLFDYLDRNGDKVLAKDEVERAPRSDFLKNLFEGAFGFRGDGQNVKLTDADANKDGKVTLEELSAYYRKTGFHALQVNLSPDQGTSDKLTDGLMQYLDANKDGKLSKEEMDAATTALHKLDVDEDELLSVEEVSAQFSSGNPYSYRRGNRPSPDALDKLGLVAVNLGEPPDRLTKLLLQRFDKDKDQKLSRTEIGLDQPVFDALDADHDGQLIAAELANYAKGPSDLELMARLGSVPPKAKGSALAGFIGDIGKGLAPEAAVDLYDPSGRPSPQASKVKKDDKGALTFTVNGCQLEMRRYDGPAIGVARNRQFLQQQFKEAAGKKDFIDKKDGMQSVYFMGLFNLADRDADGKLYEKELNVYLDLQEVGANCYLTLTLTDHGRGLFEILDANKDEKLGLRELRSAWSRLSPNDRDGDGVVARTELLRQVQMLFSQGEVYFLGRFVNQQAMRGLPQAPPRPNKGPAWFRKMDRNGDADVSLREFLGSPEDFQRIDKDGDGLIDAKEAEAGDAWFKAQAQKTP